LRIQLPYLPLQLVNFFRLSEILKFDIYASLNN
jgi:hypothetical protein